MSSNVDHLGRNPFRLPIRPSWLAKAAEKLLGLSSLASYYDQRQPDLTSSEFLDYTLASIDVTVSCVNSHYALDQLPATGPVLVVANHPLGGLEGVALAKELLARRPDTQVLTNEMLTRIPELSSIFIGVDVLSADARQQNMRGVRRASQHLSNGGVLLLFPAGKVASIDLRQRKIVDHPWNRLVGHLVRKAKPTVLPVYVDGMNSKLFYLAALIHPLLRTMLLPRELSNKQGFNLRLVFGQPMSSEELKRLDSAKAITDYLRLSTELLKPDGESRKQYQGVSFSPLADGASTSAFDQNLDGLKQYLLLESDGYQVFCAPYDAMGSFMDTLGAARELTFRQAGEGTGNAVDVDRFDPHYLHLFLWDKEKACVAGGYRIGKVDKIVAEHGLQGLYSRTLYAFNEGYLKKLGNALEIGRSFVHPDYQRQTKALDLLWRGIGAFVKQNPEYYTLFGAVSISNEHSDLARALIAECMLQSFRAEQQFLEDVKPVAPLRVSGRVWTDGMLASLTHISLVNKLIGRCDPGKALPTLLRHYLSMNGRFVCFSVNKVFNDSLDGLIIVDLRETPRRYLNRYLGKEGAETFASLWEMEERTNKTA